MAVVIKEEIGCKDCWKCGGRIKEGDASILLALEGAVVNLHPLCAKGLSLDLLRDLSILTSLGYDIEQ